MGRLIKWLFYLLVLAAIAFAGWAWIADLPPPTETRTITLPPPVSPAE